ncbi:hypothetical protein WH95_07625 [Kiloniella litopenaei]|uniref:Uncharacterized protein n=1 Tax=Kiloniella litopenaei TaxID=1549748 RepID=A0A0M2RDB2_9PROT|nr:hypothetical protein [Kiloniella litopenaei]KKJ77548.1 hypothetical protein WH95_07625 [Kiloniella litopenaei]
MKPELTIQHMLDNLSNQAVKASDITKWIKDNNGSVLEDSFWDFNNELCEGILSERWEILTDIEKFKRLFEVIQLWPCYSTATFLPRLHMDGVSSEAETFCWQQMLLILEDGSPLQRRTIEYVLWVDFFESQATSAKAWNGIMSLNPNKKAKERLLVNSGPVPYVEKKRFYHELFNNPDDHETLAECLARSLDDYYGDIDRTDAKAMYVELKVKHTNTFMSYLQKEL